MAPGSGQIMSPIALPSTSLWKKVVRYLSGQNTWFSLLCQKPEEGIGKVDSTSPPGSEEETEDSEARAVPKRRHGSRAVSPYDDPHPVYDEDEPALIPDEATGDIFCNVMVKESHCHSSHQFPGLELINQGTLFCAGRCGAGAIFSPDSSYALYAYSRQSAQSSSALYTDQDTIGHFDHSRIPPRVAFHVPQARRDVESEINDFLTSHDRQLPAMIQVPPDDPQFEHISRPP